MLYSITADAVSAIRAAMRDAVSARVSAERAAGTLNPAKENFLSRFLKRVQRLDSYSLAYFGTHPVAFTSAFLSHKRSGAMFNIYAMTKACEIARVLNGGAFDASAGGDHMTLAGVIDALDRGISNEKLIAFDLNKYARRFPGKGDYSSGPTQASSSLRALEAFGIVKMTGRAGMCALWGVANREAFARCADAARGISEHGMSADTSQNADSSTQAGRDALRDVPGDAAPVNALAAFNAACDAALASSAHDDIVGHVDAALAMLTAGIADTAPVTAF